jgi:N-acetylneuraminic acid mutarotase
VRQAAWHLPYPVARAALIGAGGRSVILAGGLLDGDVSTGQVTRIDLTHGRTKALPPLAVPVHDTAGGLVGGVPTVVGGGNSTEQAQVQALVHGRWVGVGNLPTTRSDLEVVEWRRHAYVIGGYDGSSVPRAILRLQRGAPARPVGDLLRGVRYAAVARIGSEVYVFGGEVAGRELDTVQRVDLATGHVSQAGRLPIPLGHGMAAAVGSRILLMGGRDSPEHQTDALWWFDPATHRFRKAGRLPFPLSDAAAASYGRRVWLLGGETPGVTDRVVTVTLR